MQRNTEIMSSFVVDLKYENIPQEVVERAKRQSAIALLYPGPSRRSPSRPESRREP